MDRPQQHPVLAVNTQNDKQLDQSQKDGRGVLTIRSFYGQENVRGGRKRSEGREKETFFGCGERGL
jgi:hypothetical protein